MKNQLRRTFAAALESLPSDYRQLLTLYEIEGATTKGVSDLLGITRVQARIDLLHARRAMRQRLSDRLQFRAVP
jgi:RNA polymerase sigma factor (sigma-70 family)